MEMEGSGWPLALQDTQAPNLHLGGAWRGDMRQSGKDLLLLFPLCCGMKGKTKREACFHSVAEHPLPAAALSTFISL